MLALSQVSVGAVSSPNPDDSLRKLPHELSEPPQKTASPFAIFKLFSENTL